MQTYRNEQMLANPEQFSEDTLFQPKKKLEDYDYTFDQDTVLFSTYSPDMIEERLVKSLKDEAVKNYQISKDKYKVKFEKIGIDEQDNTEDAVMITMRILRANRDTVAIQFQRLQGNKITFLKYFTQYKCYILNNFNDTPLEDLGKADSSAIKTTKFEEETEANQIVEQQ